MDELKMFTPGAYPAEKASNQLGKSNAFLMSRVGNNFDPTVLNTALKSLGFPNEIEKATTPII